MSPRSILLCKSALAALPAARAVPTCAATSRLANPIQLSRSHISARATASLHTSAARLDPSTSTSLPKVSPQEVPRNTPKGRAAFEGIRPVELAYDVVQPVKVKEGNEGQCMVICHGLFGSKQNWRSLAKAFAQRLGMPVYTLDLRNHGHSPHAEPHTYAAMATDIDAFLRKMGLKNINLLGHSMGGKAVMAFALNNDFNAELRTLVSVDMSPAVGKISPEFAQYTAGMAKVNAANVKTKSEADKILQEVEPVLATRQFLLTNTRTDTSTGNLIFRIPIDLLSRAIPHIGDFPHPPPSTSTSTSPSSSAADASPGTWPGPTMFMKGEHSKYLNKYNIPTAKEYFPNMRLEVLDAGHWVHAEQPGETVRLVSEFIENRG